MSKKGITILMFLFSVLSVHSQLSWNAKAGINLSNVTVWEGVDMKLGYQFGVGMDYYFNDHWGIQPSLMLISKGYKDKGDYSYPCNWDDVRLKSYNITENRVYLEMPVMLAYRFNVADNMKLVLNGGGYVSYGIAGKYKNEDTLEDDSKTKESNNTFSDGMEKFDAGIGAGITFEYKNKYTIGLIGEWGLKKIVANTKNRTYGLNIGYKF